MQKESVDVLSFKSCNTGADGSVFGTDVRALDRGNFFKRQGQKMAPPFPMVV